MYYKNCVLYLIYTLVTYRYLPRIKIDRTGNDMMAGDVEPDRNCLGTFYPSLPKIGTLPTCSVEPR